MLPQKQVQPLTGAQVDSSSVATQIFKGKDSAAPAQTSSPTADSCGTAPRQDISWGCAWGTLLPPALCFNISVIIFFEKPRGASLLCQNQRRLQVDVSGMVVVVIPIGYSYISLSSYGSKIPLVFGQEVLATLLRLGFREGSTQGANSDGTDKHRCNL